MRFSSSYGKIPTTYNSVNLFEDISGALNLDILKQDKFQDVNNKKITS